MRAAAILGLGCSPKDLRPFQKDETVEWKIGLPSGREQADVILLIGGDGTIHRHLEALVKLKVPVLIVPAGSGNDFARAIGLRHVRDSLAAFRRFRDGAANLRTIDLGVVTPITSANLADAAHVSADNLARSAQYFCCVAGVGLDGEIARRANDLPRWLRGHGGYVLSLAPALLRFAPLRIKIFTATEGKPDPADWISRSDQRSMLAAFANTTVYGGGMKIAPRAKMDDGLLDVCVIGGINPFKLLCLTPTVYFGRHVSIREVDYFQAARLRVETEHPLDVYADGEYVCRTPVEVVVQRAALMVLTR